MASPTRWRWVAIAAAAGLAAALAAPRPWPPGEGRLEVSGGAVLLRREAGDPLRLVLSGDAPGAVAHLVLPDGRRELVPIVRKTPEGQVAERRRPKRIGLALGLLATVVLLWVSEAVPLFVASLCVPIVLAASGAQGAREALAPFFHPLIALFFGGFLMAEAMARVGLDRFLAHRIVARAGRSPGTLLLALVGVSAFLSMWMSNTAAVAVLVPIAIAVTAPLDNVAYRKVAVLAIAYAGTIGGVGSLIGTPANPLAQEMLRSFAGREITFVSWFGYGLPMVLLFLPLMAAYLGWRGGARVEREAFRAVVAAARAGREPMSRDQGVVLGVFFAVVALFLTQGWHRIDNGIVALFGAVLLALLGKVKAEDLGRISWASLLTFGGGIALGSFLLESGTSDWMATRLEGLSSLPPYWGVAIVATLTLAMTSVASNTATAAMLIPLAIPLAGVIRVDPVLLVVVVAIASSMDFALVIGTPPTMVAHATGLFTTREIFRRGIVLDLLGVGLLVTVVSGLWRLFGLVS